MSTTNRKANPNRKPTAHDLMTPELAKQMPALYAQDGKGANAIVHAHFFLGGSDWYALEYDGKDEFFGFVCLNGDTQMAELGYFYRSELESVCVGPLRQRVERDLHWKPKTLAEAKKELYAKYGG